MLLDTEEELIRKKGQVFKMLRRQRPYSSIQAHILEEQESETDYSIERYYNIHLLKTSLAELLAAAVYASFAGIFTFSMDYPMYVLCLSCEERM